MTDIIPDNNANDDLLGGLDTTPVIVDENKSYLEELVGPGKKFKDVEALAKGKLMGDIHAKNLEKELAEVREDIGRLAEDKKARATFETLVEELRELKKSTSNDGTNPDGNETRNNPAFDPNKIEEIVSTLLSQKEKEKLKNDNFNKVKNELKKVYGDKYPTYLREQADKLGLDPQKMNEIAAYSPTAFLRLIGVNNNSSNETVPQLPHNTFKPTSGGPSHPTYSYYRKMRMEQPELYHNPKTQVQMHKDAQKYGEAFFDD